MTVTVPTPNELAEILVTMLVGAAGGEMAQGDRAGQEAAHLAEHTIELAGEVQG